MTSKSEPRTKRTEQELIAASRHVFYESDMLNYCSDRLPPNEQPIGMDYAVLMESFLIHARNLNDFFYGLDIAKENKKKPPPKDDDVIVEDFFEDNDPWKKPIENRLSTEEIEKINKQLAHISYKRPISSERGDWDFESIQMRLQLMVNEFIYEAPRAKLDQDWLLGGPGRGRVYL